MSSESIQVSVVIPTFNRVQFVRDTLDSVIAQTHRNLEVLIVDDGSAAEMFSLLQEYFCSEPRVRIISRCFAPKGSAQCRNIGMRVANGKYVLFLDSDDLLAVDCIKGRVEYLEKNPELDFAVFPGQRFSGQLAGRRTMISVRLVGDALPYFLLRDVPWVVHSVLWRRSSLFAKQLSWDERIKCYQDIQFHVDALCRELQFKLANVEPDCFWREHEAESIGKTISSPNSTESLVSFHAHVAESLTFSNNDSKDNIKRLNTFLLLHFRQRCVTHDFEQAARLMGYLHEGGYIGYATLLMLRVFLWTRRMPNILFIDRIVKGVCNLVYRRYVWPALMLNEENKIFLVREAS